MSFKKIEEKSPLEMIMVVIMIRKKLKEEYIKLSAKTLPKMKKSIINKWIDIIKILFKLDVRLYLNAFKALGDVYIEFEDYEGAKNVYLCFKYLSLNMGLLDELMLVYEALGTTYKFLFQYKKAIKCYKKQIELAWLLNNRRSELRGYDNIGIQYYYLGDRDKAKFYHQRMMTGRFEQKTDLKINTIKSFKERYFNLFDESEKLKVYKTNEELKEKLLIVLNGFFEDYGATKKIDAETLDILKVKDSFKNSFVSESDVTFLILSKMLIPYKIIF